MRLKIQSWKVRKAGQRIGFADVILDGRYLIHGVVVFAGRHGLFAAFPQQQWKGKDGVVCHRPTFEFIDPGRNPAFSAALINKLKSDYPADFDDNLLKMPVSSARKKSKALLRIEGAARNIWDFKDTASAGPPLSLRS
jgi:hypothetical protein